MRTQIRFLVIITILLFTSACSDGPGELAGTWRTKGMIPMTVTYTDNEEEVMGIISEVSYEKIGNDVIVSYESGIAKGNKVRYTQINHNTFKSGIGFLYRTSR